MQRNIMKERAYTMKKDAEQESRETLQVLLDGDRRRVNSMGRALGALALNTTAKVSRYLTDQ